MRRVPIINLDEAPATPECEKMLAVKEQSHTLSEFLDWLRDEGYTLCKWEDSDEENDYTRGYYPAHVNYEKLLARYFEIDLNKVEEERRAILEHIREERKG